MEGSGRGLFELISRNFLGRLRKTMKTELPVSRLRFKPNITSPEYKSEAYHSNQLDRYQLLRIIIIIRLQMGFHPVAEVQQ
jgi:hypothetical protein